MHLPSSITFQFKSVWAAHFLLVCLLNPSFNCECETKRARHFIIVAKITSLESGSPWLWKNEWWDRWMNKKLTTSLDSRCGRCAKALNLNLHLQLMKWITKESESNEYLRLGERRKERMWKMAASHLMVCWSHRPQAIRDTLIQSQRSRHKYPASRYLVWP